MEKITLFKFRSINKYLIDTLVKGTVYCARPIRLNDPFDCQVDIKKAAENAISRLSGKKKQNFVKLSKAKGIFNKIQKDIKSVGICSFSLVLEEPLLWSHYANEHKGLCLTYEIPGQFFFDPSNNIIGVSPVDYNVNPLTEWFIKNAPEKAGTDLNEFAIELLKKVLAIKGEGWGYEKEVRIIRDKEGEWS